MSNVAKWLEGGQWQDPYREITGYNARADRFPPALEVEAKSEIYLFSETDYEEKKSWAICLNFSLWGEKDCGNLKPSKSISGLLIYG